MNNSRTKKVYINSVITLMSQIFQVILGFLVRKNFYIYIRSYIFRI